MNFRATRVMGLLTPSLDEAHKASGNYAYSTILAYITAHHPYFRVLALTATPGSTVERVQDVVEALHISRIEIREAEAPEIRKYMNDKVRRSAGYSLLSLQELIMAHLSIRRNTLSA